MNEAQVTYKEALISLLCVHKSCEHLGIYPMIKEHLIKIGNFIEQHSNETDEPKVVSETK